MAGHMYVCIRWRAFARLYTLLSQPSQAPWKWFPTEFLLPSTTCHHRRQVVHLRHYRFAVGGRQVGSHNFRTADFFPQSCERNSDQPLLKLRSHLQPQFHIIPRRCIEGVLTVPPRLLLPQWKLPYPPEEPTRLSYPLSSLHQSCTRKRIRLHLPGNCLFACAGPPFSQPSGVRRRRRSERRRIANGMEAAFSATAMRRRFVVVSCREHNTKRAMNVIRARCQPSDCDRTFVRAVTCGILERVGCRRRSRVMSRSVPSRIQPVHFCPVQWLRRLSRLGCQDISGNTTGCGAV